MAGRMMQMSGPTMGTSWEVSLASPTGVDPTALLGDIEAVLGTIVAQMSTWRPDSVLSAFNGAPAGCRVELPEPCLSVLAAALDWARVTGGAFDPTVGPLVDLWGFGPVPPVGRPPLDEARRHTQQRLGWARVELDAVARTARQPGGVALDLSAIAKGYAVDAVVQTLRAHGVESALVDIGGELRGIGVKPDGLPWWVQLECPDDDAGTRPDLVLGLCDLAVATSGDYRRYFEHDGRRYAHTIDPGTGAAAMTGLAAVSVVHSACMAADALSTALMVLGVEAGLAFCIRHNVAAVFQRRSPDGLVEYMSPAFSALLA